MSAKNAPIKNNILEAALPDVPFDGWSLPLLQKAAVSAGYSAAMVKSVFPSGVKDALVHFASMADDAMMKDLAALDPQTLKIRERVAIAVDARLEWLDAHKEAERLALSYWARPFRKWEGARILWNTADIIWNWAGDTATDYNHYTKRGLLSGVIATTTLFWLNDTSAQFAETKAFLRRRIENVMRVGKLTASLKRA